MISSANACARIFSAGAVQFFFLGPSAAQRTEA